MKKIIILLVGVAWLGCNTKTKDVLTAQQIVDNAIEVSGGELHQKVNLTFNFRDITYISQVVEGNNVLKRIIKTDTAIITDIRTLTGFKRLVNDSVVSVVDSIATKYSNSINSVHYFVRLPYGLNASAVSKELLGEATIKNQEYYKVKITFDEKGGGEDFEDIYIYWFNKQTYKPAYLAYQFYTDGGGQRFREAYNERFVNGIRFVDYKNYKPKDKSTNIMAIDSLYKNGALELLSKIELTDIEVGFAP